MCVVTLNKKNGEFSTIPVFDGEFLGTKIICSNYETPCDAQCDKE